MITTFDTKLYMLYHNEKTKKQAIENAINYINQNRIIEQVMFSKYPFIKTSDYFEDLKQECFVTIIKSFANFNPSKSTFKTWAVKYINSTLYQKSYFFNNYSAYNVKKYGRIIFEPLQKSPSKNEYEFLPADIDIEENYILKESMKNKLKQLDEMMKNANLTTTEIKAIKAKYYNNLSFKEIAQELNISPTTAENHIINARRKLKQLYNIKSQKYNAKNRTGYRTKDRKNRPIVIVSYRNCNDIDVLIKGSCYYYFVTNTRFDKIAKKRDLLCHCTYTIIDADKKINGKRVETYFL